MNNRPLLIKGGRIIDPRKKLDQVGDVLLEDGKVSSVGAVFESTPPECEVLDATGLVVTPGFIDMHCHLREPGEEDKETIATGTRAAVRGGFTTVCCMPNTIPAIDNVSTVNYVLEKAEREGAARVLCIGAVTRGRQGNELSDLRELADAGVIGFSDDGNPIFDPVLMRSALIYTSALKLPVINHCEETRLVAGGVMNEGEMSTRLGLRGAPSAAEDVMVARDIALAELTGGWLHLAHVSTANSVDMVRQAKMRGIRITAEVTPHHLTLTDYWVAGEQGRHNRAFPLTTVSYDTSTKVNPPLRSAEDVNALVQGVRDGVIDVIATDHAPHTIVDKDTTYDEAAFGISNLETSLGSLLSLVHEGQLDLITIVERLSSAPAHLLGTRGENLGTLSPGAMADVVLFDLNHEWLVDVSEFASKGLNTPLKGQKLKGRVMTTIVAGEIRYRSDSGIKLEME